MDSLGERVRAGLATKYAAEKAAEEAATKAARGLKFQPYDMAVANRAISEAQLAETQLADAQPVEQLGHSPDDESSDEGGDDIESQEPDFRFKI